MFKLKKKNKLCRKYAQDIWGLFIKQRKPNKVVEYLVNLKKQYRSRKNPFFLDITAPIPLKQRRVYSRFSKNLDTLKKLGFFSGGLRRKKFKQMVKIAKAKPSKSLEIFYYLIELRLVVIVYRMNFCQTILEAIQYIYAGYILINKEIIKNPNHIAKVGDIIEIINYKRKAFLTKYKHYLRFRKLIVLQPHFTIMNYELLLCQIVGGLAPGLMCYPFKVAKQYGYMFVNSRI